MSVGKWVALSYFNNIKNVFINKVNKGKLPVSAVNIECMALS